MPFLHGLTSSVDFLDYDGGLTALGRTYIGAETKVKTGPAEGDPADGASSLTVSLKV